MLSLWHEHLFWIHKEGYTHVSVLLTQLWELQGFSLNVKTTSRLKNSSSIWKWSVDQVSNAAKSGTTGEQTVGGKRSSHYSSGTVFKNRIILFRIQKSMSCVPLWIRVLCFYLTTPYFLSLCTCFHFWNLSQTGVSFSFPLGFKIPLHMWWSVSVTKCDYHMNLFVTHKTKLFHCDYFVKTFPIHT